ncbi:hypothetical protein PSTT_04119 [Puccinia striiformis]|uniref:Cyclin-like domain-containing protein n=2 Tax=Puccinia striiformis TaxID=27350 RepID=A0A2S4VTQ4_9BASI|nr:hypothetical protein PSTT_04119 [Puccinia striiformis]
MVNPGYPSLPSFQPEPGISTRMADYVFRIPSPTVGDRSKLGSTAGDSSIGTDQWLWPPQALYGTPSQKLGMGWPEEIHLRARAVNWIVRTSINLQLPQLIIATAAAYVHRFYMRKPLQRYPSKLMSATALFLATKVEEVPRKLEFVVKEYLSIDEDGNERPGLIADSSNVTFIQSSSLLLSQIRLSSVDLGPIDDNTIQQEFQALKQEILYYEDILLRTLCFDLAIDHPYVTLIHSVKYIHESHSRARAPRSSLAVEMADRAKAKSITQAAWGFVNDSLMTPLCLVAKPELIAASAFLLAVSHRLSESPLPLPDKQEDDQESLPVVPKTEKHPIDFNRFLNLPPARADGDQSTQEPWWKAFQVESLDEIHQVANAMLDQYVTSVCEYIRDRASKLARFPGPSILHGPVEIVKVQRSPPQPNSKMSPEKPTERSTPPLPPQPAGKPGERLTPTPANREEELSRAVSSTPSRALMSDSMDLGTPNESTSPSPKRRPILSPPVTNLEKPTHVPVTKEENLTTHEVLPQKRSRSPESTTNLTLQPEPKNLKVDHLPSATLPPNDQPLSAPLPPEDQHTSAPPPPDDQPPSTPPPPPLPSMSEAPPPTPPPPATTTAPVSSTESSLSDMEDGELD